MEQLAKDDKRLLERYVSERSEAAFACLVERHIKLVYSTCYRELGRCELAEEAAQAAFITLARKARAIRDGANLVPWLYTTARFEASVLRRQEQRQMAKQQRMAEEAVRYSEREHSDPWSTIEPALNDAISALPYLDQKAILLRFFEEKSLREVGQEMGTNEDAAQKRVARALEKLRMALADRRAATISTVAFAALLTKHATYAVPAHLPASVAQSACALNTLPLSPPFFGAGGHGGGFIAKGLLIVSAYKLAALAAAAIILLLGVLLFAEHRLRFGLEVLIPSSGQIAARYRLSEVGYLPGYSIITNARMNDNGDVVGTTIARGRQSQCSFYYHDGVTSAIPVPGGYDEVDVDGIDDQGTIWGEASSKKQGPVAVVAGTKDGLHVYATYPTGKRGGKLRPVHDQAEIVYSEHTGMNQFTLFTVADGRQIPMATVPNCSRLTIDDINTKGDAVGEITSSRTGLDHGYLFSEGKLLPPPMLPGASSSSPAVISDSGYVSGLAWIPGSDTTQSWLYHNGAYEALNTLPGYQTSFVRWINDAGIAVGMTMSKGRKWDAIAYVNGSAVDLNSRIDPGAGIVLKEAQYINDRGDILCWGHKDGKYVLVLMTPQT